MGEVEVNGLIGEVNENEGYAFVMNGFQQAGALTPLAKYDKRYARTLGKWLANLPAPQDIFTGMLFHPIIKIVIHGLHNMILRLASLMKL